MRLFLRGIAAAGLLVLCTATLQGCRSGASGGRVLVLAFDGMDPQTVDLLMSEGKLPNFARLRREGAYGRLQSMRPMLSPILWTTIATGRRPTDHGIGHFTATDQAGNRLPVTSGLRRVKALWNLFSEAERRVGVVGWWATWPAEEVNGSLVSDHVCYHFLFEDGFRTQEDTSGNTWPAELGDVIAPLVVRPHEVPLETLEPFARVTAEDLSRPFSFDDDVGHLRWALATARSYSRIGLHLWEAQTPDLLMVYVEATDSAAHLFGHLFRQERLAGDLAEQQRKFGQTVEAVYLHADRLLGEYLESVDEDTTLVVLSDHGFQLGQLHPDPTVTRNLRRVSERYHRPEGILYLHGRNVRARARISSPTLLDVAPTVLALSGIAPGQDMPGRILQEAFVQELSEERVPTHEGEPGTAGARQPDDAVNPLILEKLESLGYVGASSPSSDRTLANLHFEDGQFDEAIATYMRLIAEDPEDASLHVSLAGAFGAAGRYEEAERELVEAIRLNPIRPEAYHNRGVLYERMSRRDDAVEQYRLALRYSPQYAPSREALVRLTGSGSIFQAADETEERAVALTEQAADLARRGNYAAADAALDEAERLAPTLVRVHQYRSNVAYLQGDPDRAIAALTRALELEPDNALFRANLDGLLASVAAEQEQSAQTAPANAP